MGKKIQNYILQTVVGSGQFGKVYKAFNQKTNQVVAIKVIQIQKFRLSPKLQQFTINQINTLSKIQDSTHIVRFIQILKTANNYYFVYEFCNEGTLQQKIKSQGKFSQQKALSYFKQLLQAFRMLIKNNIMHRDIKPSNILLNNGVIKLADFGFCKPMKDSKDLAQTMLGSPIYMAPEILKGEIYTMKADIWSLGVVLYQMLYGFCPFEQRSIARLINLIEQGTVSFPSNVKISKNTEDLLRKMLIKDQFKRIQWKQLLEYNLINNTNQTNKILNNQFNKNINIIDQTKYFNKSSSSSKKQLINIDNISNNKVNNNNNNNDNMSINQPQISNPFSKKHFQSVSNNIEEQRKYIIDQKVDREMNMNNTSNQNNPKTNNTHNTTVNNPRAPLDQLLSNPRHNSIIDITSTTNNNNVRNNSSNRKYYQNERGVSQQKNRRRSNTVHDIRDVTNVTLNHLNTNGNINNNNINMNININNNYNNNNINLNKQKDYLNLHFPTGSTNNNNISLMKKNKSTTTNCISDVQKKILQNILQNRNKIFRGIKMIQKYLIQSNSKLNVAVCCFIAKKVKEIAIETEEIIRKNINININNNINNKPQSISNKQNQSSSIKQSNQFPLSQICHCINLIQQQLLRVRQKLIPFESQLQNIHQPQDIIFLRYGQEQHLTQQKQGLTQLLNIDDYFNGQGIGGKRSEDNHKGKDELKEYGVIGNINANTNNNHNHTNNININNINNSHSIGLVCVKKHGKYDHQNKYHTKTKKQLLEEYERRILRNV